MSNLTPGQTSPVPHSLARFEESIGAILLVLVFGSIALQIVTRFIFRDPLFWTEEAARYLFVWLVAIGSAECVRNRSHIAMDVFTTLLPPRPRLILSIVLNTAIVAALLFLCWYGFFGTLRAHRVMSVAVGVQESLLYGALPVGAALLAIRMVAVIIGDVIVLTTPHKIADDDLPPANERYL